MIKQLAALTLFSRAYAGERIFGSGVPIGGEDMYILGSSGKSMTSTMAARVVAKGYISWKTTTKEIFHDTVRVRHVLIQKLPRFSESIDIPYTLIVIVLAEQKLG